MPVVLVVVVLYKKCKGQNDDIILYNSTNDEVLCANAVLAECENTDSACCNNDTKYD